MPKICVEKWSPFREAEYNLMDYNHFFPHEIVESIFDHPQNMEDWLDEISPNKYCYVWIYSNLWERNKNGITIVGRLIGVPEKIAIALKIITGLDPTQLNDYDIRKNRYKQGTYNIEAKNNA